MVPDYAWWLTSAVALAVVLIDLVLALNRTEGDTYSEVIRAWARKRIAVVILLSFAMGLLAGHWFWASCTSADCQELGVIPWQK